jgi:hypothetical protein
MSRICHAIDLSRFVVTAKQTHSDLLKVSKLRSNSNAVILEQFNAFLTQTK